MTSNFELKLNNDAIYIKKDGNEISINGAINNDIWFKTNNTNPTINLNFDSINEEEWKTYIVLEDFMKRIYGKYLIDSKTKSNDFPQDFIDLDNNTITIHSETKIDNAIKIQYMGNIIKISFTKDLLISDENETTRIVIKKDNSNYSNYYQEFIKLYIELYNTYNMKYYEKNESDEIKQKKLVI